MRFTTLFTTIVVLACTFVGGVWTAEWWKSRPWWKTENSDQIEPQSQQPSVSETVPTSRSIDLGTAKLSSEWWGLSPAPKPSASGEEAPLPSYNRQWAVIIGVNAYTDKRADDLEFAHNDARAIRDILISDFGYKADSILYLTAVREGGLKDGPAVPAKDSPGEELKTGLADLATLRGQLLEPGGWLSEKAKEMTEKDAFLFFFAGHGDQEERTDSGFLLASDSAPDDPATVIPISSANGAGSVVERVAALPCRHKLMILDCCFSGSLFKGRSDFAPTGRSDASLERSGDSRNNLDTYFSQEAFYGISAGRSTPVADGFGDFSHSIFSRYLLKVLRERANTEHPKHTFTFRQLATQVESQVAFELGSGQVPDWGRLSPGDGDFVFQVASQPDPNPTPREAGLAEQGRKLLGFARDRIEQDGVHTFPDVQFLAAKALGFQGYGRENFSVESRFLARSPVCFLPHLHPADRREALNLAKGRDSRLRAPVLVWASPRGSIHDRVGTQRVAFSHDGEMLLTAGWATSGSKPEDREAYVWDLESGQQICTLQFPGSGTVREVMFGPDNRRVAMFGSKSFGLWDTQSGRRLDDLSVFRGDIVSVRFSSDGAKLIVLDETMRIQDWDAEAGMLLGYRGRNPGLALNEQMIPAIDPSGSRIAQGFPDGTILIWDQQTGEEIHRWRAFESEPLFALTFSHDGRKLAGASLRKADRGTYHWGRIKLWDGESFEEIAAVDGLKKPSYQGREVDSQLGTPDVPVSFVFAPTNGELHGDGFVWKFGADALEPVPGIVASPNGRWVAEKGYGWNTLGIKDKAEGFQMPKGHSFPIDSLTIDPTGTKVIGASKDEKGKTLHLCWDLLSGKQLNDPPWKYDGVAFGPSGKRVIGWMRGGTFFGMRNPDATWGGMSGPVMLGGTQVYDLAFSNWEGKFGFIDTRGGRHVWDFDWPPEQVDSFGRALDRVIIQSPPEGYRRWTTLWDLPTKRPMVSWWHGTEAPIQAPGIPVLDENLAASWDLVMEEEAPNFSGEFGKKTLSAVAFSPDKMWMAARGYGLTLRNLETREEKILRGEDFTVAPERRSISYQTNTRYISYQTRCLAFSPRGDRLVSAGEDGRVHFWNTATFDLDGILRAHPTAVTQVAFGGDGELMVTGAEDGTIRAWQIPSVQPVAKLSHAGFGFDELNSKIAFVPHAGGKRVVASIKDGIGLWDERSGALLAVHPAKIDFGRWAVSPTGDAIAWISDGRVETWNLKTGEFNGLPRYEIAKPAVCLTYDSNGKQLIVVTTDGKVRFLDSQTAARVREPLQCPHPPGWAESEERSGDWLPLQGGQPVSLAQSKDGNRLVLSMPSQIVAWDERGQTRRLEHYDTVGICLSADGNTLVSFSNENKDALPIGRVWNLESVAPPRLLQLNPGKTSDFRAPRISPDGSRVFAATEGEKGPQIIVWDTASGNRLLTVPKLPKGNVFDLALSQTDAALAAVVWDDEQGSAAIQTWRIHLADDPPNLADYVEKKLLSLDEEKAEVRWVRNLYDSDRSGDLYRASYGPANFLKGSLLARLRSEPDETKREKIYLRHFLDRQLWTQAWASWQRIPENQRSDVAADFFETLCLLAVKREPPLPAAWFAERLPELLQASKAELAEHLEPVVLTHFIKSIADSENPLPALKQVALESLEIMRESGIHQGQIATWKTLLERT